MKRYVKKHLKNYGRARSQIPDADEGPAPVEGVWVESIEGKMEVCVVTPHVCIRLKSLIAIDELIGELQFHRTHAFGVSETPR